MRRLFVYSTMLVLMFGLTGAMAATDREAQLRADLEEDPGNPITLYNLACIVSLDNRPAEAMDLLEESIINGFLHFEHLLVNDQDLNNCRKDPMFEDRMMAAIERRRTMLEEQSEQEPYRAAQNQYELALVAAELDEADAAVAHLKTSLRSGFDDFLKLWNESNFGSYWSDSTLMAVHDSVYDAVYGWTGTTEQKIAGLMKVWSEAKYNFVYFDQIPQVDWDALCESYIPRVIAAETIDEYYVLLQELTAKLQDGHTGVFPPNEVNKRYGHVPIECVWIDGRGYVDRIGATESLQATGLERGMEIVAIDGVPVMEQLQTNVINRYCYGRLMGTMSIGQRYLMWGPKDKRVELTWRDFDGELHTATVQRGRMQTDSTRFLYTTQSGRPYARFERLDDGVVYCNLLTMSRSELVDDFKAVFDTLDLSEVSGFILDVRENGGGSSSNGFHIISHFIDSTIEAAYWKSRKYIPTFAAWGREQGWHEGGLTGSVQPVDGKRFLGPLVVLTGPYTFSAAEDFVVPLDYANRAVLVGDTTGGSTGQPLMMLLPGGGSFRVCTKRDVYPDGSEFCGIGIAPDVVVLPTVEDLRSDRDPVIEKATDVIANWETYQAGL